MKRFVVRIATAITIVSLLAAAVWYVMPPARPADGQTPDAATADVIQTAAPIRKDFEIVEPWIGRTESKRVARIVALEEGKLVSIDAEDQAQVEEGSALFTLGGTRLDSRLEAIGEEVRSLRQRLTIAEKLVKRKESIIQQRIGRQVELEDARHRRLGLETQLKTATAALQRIEDATRIVAPFAGVFTKRTVCVGQNLSQGERLGEVIDPAHVRVIATLFPPDGALLKGQTATVRTDSGGRIIGFVTRVLPERTPVGGTVVWLEGDAIDRHLTPGQRVAGEIRLSTHKAALAIAERAIVRDRQQAAYVFVSREGGYEKQQVRTGLVSNGWMEILSGIEQQDTIVVLGAYGLYYQDFSDVYKVAD